MKNKPEEVRAWIWEQQQLYAHGWLSPERIAKCESIPSWKWTGESAPSDEVFETFMKTSSKKHGEKLVMPDGRTGTWRVESDWVSVGNDIGSDPTAYLICDGCKQQDEFCTCEPKIEVSPQGE